MLHTHTGQVSEHIVVLSPKLLTSITLNFLCSAKRMTENQRTKFSWRASANQNQLCLLLAGDKAVYLTYSRKILEGMLKRNRKELENKKDRGKINTVLQCDLLYLFSFSTQRRHRKKDDIFLHLKLSFLGL